MSIRYIGTEKYIPATPGNYARGQTRIIRSSTVPDEHEEKKTSMKRYREELDRQVA